MPQETFGVGVQSMDEEFRFDTRQLVESGPEGTKVTVVGASGGGDRRRRGSISREEQGVSET
jgi:hypothetical protein